MWGAGDGLLRPISFNPDTARTLLNNCDVNVKGAKRYFKDEPVSVKFIYNSGRVVQGSPEEDIIKDLVSDLRRIQIEIEVISCPAREFERKLINSDYDMAFQYYELGYGGNIAPLFTEGDMQNISRFSDLVLSDYLGKYNRTSGVQRKEYGKKIHQIVYKEAPYIFLYRLDKIMAYRNELETSNQIVPRYFFTHIGDWYFKY